MANWVRYPLSLFFLSVSPLHGIREVEVRYPPPPQKGYLSDTCAIPYENKANGCDTPLCDTISKGYCAIWGGISHWAAIRMDYHQGFAQADFRAEKKGGPLWGFSAYFPVFKAEKGPQKICAKPWLPVIRA